MLKKYDKAREQVSAEEQERLLEKMVHDEFDLNDFRLPRELPVSLPSALARQRPDILAAEARLHADSAARYVEPGYLAFLRNGNLMVQRFSAARLQLRGQPVKVADNVRVKMLKSQIAQVIKGQIQDLA